VISARAGPVCAADRTHHLQDHVFRIVPSGEDAHRPRILPCRASSSRVCNSTDAYARPVLGTGLEDVHAECSVLNKPLTVTSAPAAGWPSSAAALAPRAGRRMLERSSPWDCGPFISLFGGIGQVGVGRGFAGRRLRLRERLARTGTAGTTGSLLPARDGSVPPCSSMPLRWPPWGSTSARTPRSSW
jgi:hypothetical protein